MSIERQVDRKLRQAANRRNTVLIVAGILLVAFAAGIAVGRYL